MKLAVILFLVTCVCTIDIPIFNDRDLAAIRKRDACSGSCVDAGKAEVNKCKLGQANPTNEQVLQEFNCLCNLPDSFYNDLSDCIKNCDQVNGGGLDGTDTSPSGLRQLYCESAASFSSFFEEFSGTLGSAFGGGGGGLGGGLGGFATADVGAAETDTGNESDTATDNAGDNGTNTGTGTHTTNTDTHTTNTGGGTTNGNGTTKTDTSASSKTESSTKESSKNAGSSIGICSIIYLMIMALI
ncbi:hypothetical protein JA1_004283 [Spathaspora sp. JA1]|nr:hypothetical protein JA1_004283 [Spathaspora sp. JA1]